MLIPTRTPNSHLGRPRSGWLQTLVTALVSLGVLLGPLIEPSSAHASLVASSPAKGQVVGGALTHVDLVFNESVDAPVVTVHDPSGEAVAITVDQPAPNHLRIGFESPPSLEGAYRVGYQLISADEDPLNLILEFVYDAEADPALPVVSTAESAGGGGIFVWVALGVAAVAVSASGVRVLRSRQELARLSG